MSCSFVSNVWSFGLVSVSQFFCFTANIAFVFDSFTFPCLRSQTMHRNRRLRLLRHFLDWLISFHWFRRRNDKSVSGAYCTVMHSFTYWLHLSLLPDMVTSTVNKQHSSKTTKGQKEFVTKGQKEFVTYDNSMKRIEWSSKIYRVLEEHHWFLIGVVFKH